MDVSYRHTNLSIYAPTSTIFPSLAASASESSTATHPHANLSSPGYHHDKPSLSHPTTFLYSLVDIGTTALLPRACHHR